LIQKGSSLHSLIIPKRVLDGIDWTACPMQFPGFLKGKI
jgi:hypothetical protein